MFYRAGDQDKWVLGIGFAVMSISYIHSCWWSKWVYSDDFM